jgi:hypothetical protein
MAHPLLPDHAFQKCGIPEEGHSCVERHFTLLREPGNGLESKRTAVFKDSAQLFDLRSTPHQYGPMVMAQREKNCSQPARQRPVGTNE